MSVPCETKEDCLVQPDSWPYQLETGANGTWSDQLWYAAGASSPTAQFLIIVAWGAFLLFPMHWSTYYMMFNIRGLRSEVIFGVLFGFVFPGVILAAMQEYAGRDAFVYFKTYSLVVFCETLIVFKYFTGFPHQSLMLSWAQALILHGMLALNILEASLWELIVMNYTGVNYLNGVNGLFLCLFTFFYTYYYGVGITSARYERERQLKANLTPSFILAYTFWNLEYMCTYWPDKCAYYVITTLFVPLFVAFVGRLDWLETRAHTLLYAISIRLFPWGGNGSLIATIGLGYGTFNDQGFKWAMCVLGVIFSAVSLVEGVLIVTKKRSYFAYGLPADKFAISRDHPGSEALEAAMHAAHRLSVKPG